MVDLNSVAETIPPSFFSLESIQAWLSVGLQLVFLSLMLLILYRILYRLFSRRKFERHTLRFKKIARVLLIIFTFLLIPSILSSHTGCNTSFYTPEVLGYFKLKSNIVSEKKPAIFKANFSPTDEAQFLLGNTKRGDLGLDIYYAYLKLKYSAFIQGIFPSNKIKAKGVITCDHSQKESDEGLKELKVVSLESAPRLAGTLIFNKTCHLNPSIPDVPIRMRFEDGTFGKHFKNCTVLIAGRQVEPSWVQLLRQVSTLYRYPVGWVLLLVLYWRSRREKND